MNSRNFAYIRVSSLSQSLNRQFDAIKKLDVVIDDRDIYTEKASGKDLNRPEWKALKRSIRKCDCLYIVSLDRIGRNKKNILEEWKWLMDNGIDIVVLDMPLLDTRKYKELNGVGELVTNLVLQILTWLAEEERTKIKQRQKEGIQSAKARNIKFGRPAIQIDNSFFATYNRWKNDEITAVKAMEVLNMKKTTFYKKVKEFESTNKVI
ncbi:recombinase family protein [Clostridium sp.]|uniref:recombinase family protein n=1 Tax=Clostridium sp. TaxID=1506 RepID=UPI002583829C|nr:recombinase family protein [Clostridium sp.]MDF2503064.1 recombinase family protein [Clostridium sp.]